MIIIELIAWGFSIFIGVGFLGLMAAQLVEGVKTGNDDVEFLIKEKIWEKDSKITNTFDRRFSIDDPFNFED